MRVLAGAALYGCLLGAAGVATAEDLGSFGAWFAESHEEGGAPVCSMWSTPESSEGDYDKRGPVFVFVTHRPRSERIGEVFIETGYDYLEDSEVKVIIGGASFRLLTSGSTAWTLNQGDERRLVAAMRAGAHLVIEGTSARGTKTRDTYSLIGFTAANKAINEACGVE